MFQVVEELDLKDSIVMELQEKNGALHVELENLEMERRQVIILFTLVFSKFLSIDLYLEVEVRSKKLQRGLAEMLKQLFFSSLKWTYMFIIDQVWANLLSFAIVAISSIFVHVLRLRLKRKEKKSLKGMKTDFPNIFFLVALKCSSKSTTFCSSIFCMPKSSLHVIKYEFLLVFIDF